MQGSGGGGQVGAVEIRPVTPAAWSDVEAVFTGRGDPGRCWCQWFQQPNARWRLSSPQDRREDLRDEVRAGGDPPPGLLAVVDGRPTGWCRVGPRTSYPRLTSSAKVRAVGGGDPDDPTVWSAVCFVVRAGARRSGLSAVLLDAAVELARRHGARVVEAYPVDVAARPGAGAADLYHGVLSTFLSAGFVEVGRTTAARPVVRLQL